MSICLYELMLPPLKFAFTSKDLHKAEFVEEGFFINHTKSAHRSLAVSST
jgi:hypothetical protein